MKTPNNSYWQSLLVNWRALGRNGLTVPYIVGGQKYLPPTHKHQSIEALLIDISNNNDYAVYITYCTDINEIILGLRDSSKLKIAGRFPPIDGKDQTKLFLTSVVDNLGEDVISIAHSLGDRFQHYIDKGAFSKWADDWADYSESEKQFIRDCFQS